jgi:hypothetical protein
MQRYIRMVCGIVVHQWHKEADEVHYYQQGEEKNVNASGKKWLVQPYKFPAKL